MTNGILYRHRHAIALRTGVLVKRGVLSKSVELQVEQGLAEPMALLAQRDLLPAKLDRDEVKRLNLLRACLLRRARLGRRAALHPALDHGLLLPRDEHGRDVRHALVFRLAQRDAIHGHAHEARLPHLTRESAQRGRVLRGGQRELGEDAGDGGVVAEEVGEEALAVTRAHARCRARAWEREPVVDGRYVCEGVADVDDDAGERADGVELRHWPVEDTEGRYVEALEKDLARALVGFAWEAGDEGKQDGRLVLDASELQAREEDVLPVCTPPHNTT